MHVLHLHFAQARLPMSCIPLVDLIGTLRYMRVRFALQCFFIYTVLNWWVETTCLSSLSTHLAPTLSGVLLSPNPGRLIRTLRKGWSLPYAQYLELRPGSQIVIA